MAERVGSNGVNDAEDLAQVAALVARAGLRLPADQLIGLATAYRTDRAGFERLRAIIAADAHEQSHDWHTRRPSR